MKTKLGIMGSARPVTPGTPGDLLHTKATALAAVLAAQDIVLLTGATTGVVYAAGKAAHDAGVLHIGISPASNEHEHTERYGLPTDACDVLIYTGFGLKGRNVVLVRSCDIVLFVAGGMGSLNEFTIAHDEGKVMGCLTGTGGVADEADYLLRKFSTNPNFCILQDEDPAKLVAKCLRTLQEKRHPASTTIS